MDVSSTPQNIPSPDPDESKIIGEVEKGKTVSIFESQALNQGLEKTETQFPITEDLPEDAFAAGPDNPFNWSKKRKWMVVATVSCMMLLNVIATMACTPAIPLILDDFKTQNQSYYVLIVSIWELGECLGPFFIGPLADHYGRLPVWHVCNIIYVGCSLISGFSSNISMLLIFRVLNGFVAAPLTLGPTIVSDMFSPEQRGGALGIAQLIPLTGLSWGPIIGSAVLGNGRSWRWIFWVLAITVGGVEICSIISTPETHYATVRRRCNKDESLAGRPKFELIMVLRAFKIWFFYPIAFVIAVQYASLWGFGYIIFTTLTEFENQYNILPENSGLYCLGWGLGYALGLFVGGTVSDWYIRRKKASRGSTQAQDRIPLAIAGGIIAAFGFFLYGWTVQTKVHLIAPVLASTIQNFGTAVVSISCKVYLVDAFPDYAASAIGAGSILMSLCGALIPLAGPPLYTSLGYGWGNSILGFITLALTPLPFTVLKLTMQGKSSGTLTRRFDQPYPLALVAWAILSATYSADNEASIDILGHSQRRDVVHIQFQVDDGDTVENVYNQILEELAAGKSNECSIKIGIDGVQPSKDLNFPNGAKAFKEASSGLPKVLTAANIDAAVYELVEEATYDLAITLDSGEGGKNKFHLRACSKSSLAQSELDLILTRCKDLIIQLHGAMHKRIQELDLLITSDRENLSAMNEGMPPVEYAFVHELVAQQARLTPNNEAICAWDGSLTYEELEQKASGLAKHLVQRGVNVRSWVPLLFGKSKWHIVSMLAVMKTGAAFVSLDVTMPVGRIANVLKQLDSISLALTSADQHRKFQGIVDSVVVFHEKLTTLDTLGGVLPAPGVEDGIHYDQPVYVIFTSGSTGIPKGAVIEHRNLTTQIKALNQELNFSSDMRSFQLNMLNFDFCISEIFCPLLCGGCVCIPSEWSRFNDIPGAVDSLNANLISLSPTLLSTMSITDFPKLKSILLSGERVWKDLNDLWTDAGKKVMHMYGPTECTVASCFLDTSIKPHYTGLIGSTYANKFWIVDSQNSDKLQPLGAPGEILIEGPTVGRGYLGDLKKTEEIFIAPPIWFSSICQRKPIRFYKTGDLGRLTKHGEYEIVGRKDSQIKIRGWRIEVLEIEHQIRLASGFGAAVEVRNPTLVPGQEQLVAFLELQKSRDHESTTADVDVLWKELESNETQFSKMIGQLEARLRDILPTYMIPSAYVPIRTFPMTNIFKLNRRKLKETANKLDISAIRNSKSGPRGNKVDQHLSEDEKKLLEIWTEVLHVSPDTIGNLDDFFRYRRRFFEGDGSEDEFDGAQNEPFSLLDGSIVPRILAVAAEQCQIATGLIEDIMPLTDMQDFYITSQVRQPRCWMSTASFELGPSVDANEVVRLWEQLMAHHPITRTRFVNSPFGLFQVILKSESVIWKSSSDVANLLKDLEGDILGLGFPSHTSGLLINEEQRPSQLIWYANHAVLDQLMLEFLSEELEILCTIGSAGLPSRPPFKRLVQHRYDSDKGKSHKFWHSHLSGANYKALFKDDQVTDLLADSKLSGETELTVPAWFKVSEYAVAMTTLALTLADVTGNEDIAFMLVRSGRVGEMAGSEDVVGPVLTRAPLRISVKWNRSIADLLRDVDRDFQESGKHEIVRLDDFLSASPEAAAHLQHALWLNFRPPTEGLTLGRDALFPVNSDFREGMAERNQIIAVFGEIFRGKLKMDVMWEMKSIPRNTVERLLGGWKAMIQLLSRTEPSLTVGKILDA
ncbi:hypothetical protein G7Y89_g4407 [Cudoniella acicularis]|uniref:Major facilitator superfamily (MFS) profile domain-containing protein n=1 Tax=Cudoniella acicularis TaxID=354080 RepID=A0A8H4RPI9_9HELO|nr:hypothetical protein G7Y89_g4407 [Cudoniella acicularis]